MYFNYGVPLALTVIGLLFMVAMIGLQKLLAPRNPFARKLMPYECGEPPTGSAWINYNVRFYPAVLAVRGEPDALAWARRPFPEVPIRLSC